jgi:hypothetical protein
MRKGGINPTTNETDEELNEQRLEPANHQESLHFALILSINLQYGVLLG